MKLVCLLVSGCLLCAAAPKASSLYKKARKAEAKGDHGNAYLLYSQAVAMDPNNGKYWAASQAIRELAADKLTVVQSPVPSSLEPVSAPLSTLSSLTDEERIQAMYAKPIQLIGAEGVKDFDLRGNAKELWEQVAKQFGVEVVFDADYEASKPLRFKFDNAGYRDAFRAMETVTASFLVPISERMILIAKDTQQKRVDLEPNVSLLIPYPESITPQELTEASTVVRTLFDITKMSVDNGRRLIYLRDRQSRARMAERVIQQLLLPRGQVMVEVELLSASESSTTSYGIALPNTFSLNWLTNKNFLRPTPLPGNLTGLLLFGGGYTLFGIGITDARIFASATRSISKSLVRSHLMSMDGQTASLHLGDKYPIITLGYYGGTPVTSDQQAYAPPPNIQFEDLGIVLKIIPKVHNSEEVSLDVEAEFKALTGQTANNIPVISNRKFKSIVRMRFDEAAIMAGLTGESSSQSWTGIPGLVKIPLLRENNKSQDQGDILVVLKPRLISLPPSEAISTPIWTGTETHYLPSLD